MPNKPIVKTIESKFFRLRKLIYESLLRKPEKQTLVFVVGCQRSGTSLMMDIFDRDLRSTAFREASIAFDQLRLIGHDQIMGLLSNLRSPIVVFKPLLDSQRISEILEAYPNSYALWLFRHFHSVAKSNNKYFGSDRGAKDIAPIVNNESGNWRNENVSDETRAIIKSRYTEDMDPSEAASLFWFARNQSFFDHSLEDNPRILLCKYEDVVTLPSETMQMVYSLTASEYPGDHIVKQVHRQALRRGTDIVLQEPTESLCQEMQQKLDNLYNDQKRRYQAVGTGAC